MPTLEIPIFAGTLAEIIRNDDDLYPGNLDHYFAVVFFQAKNLFNPYHNFRHMTQMMWLTYQAIVFDHQNAEKPLTLRQVRNILIAALFHDFDHCGKKGDDSLNIEMAKAGLRAHILADDARELPHIERLIEATQFPHKVIAENLSLSEQIMRDADMGQAFSVAWIQQVVFGLAAEWSMEAIEILEMQIPFLRNLKFHTTWGQETFPEHIINAKIAEVMELLQILQARRG